MFGSMQIKQEYGEAEEKNIPNIVASQDVIDCMVFENQNLQCSYHQLPHFWDQALQIQNCNQYSKNHSQKSESSEDSDVCRTVNNPSGSIANPGYVNQQVHLQQQQNNAFAISQLIPNVQTHTSSKDHLNTNTELMSTAISNGAMMNPVASEIIIENKPKSSGRPKKSPGTAVKKCQCEICFKEFGHKSNLFIHMRTHNGERPHKCKECGKSFTHSGNLAIHMRTHSGERPYTCQICGKTFSHSGNLSTHQRTHSGVKPFKCRICAKEFRHSGNLSIHERIHSGVKPFQCKVCGKEFYHSGNLSTHVKKHSVGNIGESNNIPASNTNYNLDTTEKDDSTLTIDSNDTKVALSSESEALVTEHPRKNQMQINTFM